MIKSELMGREPVASWPTEFTHAFRLPGVRCGGRIYLINYKPTTNFPVGWTTLAHCDRCRQTAVWDG